MQHRTNNTGIYPSILTVVHTLTEYTSMVNDTKYIWCYKSLCIGMITLNNQLSFVKTLNKSMLCHNKKHITYFL